ncbi:MAG: hypothetical protein NVSMB17_03830 [Candidatus Dormibacteria bacterium]
MKVLLVDDDSPNLELYRLAFTMRGHEVITANSGARALEIYIAEKPDAVICDLILGDMVGTEVIEKMREVQACRFYLLSETDPAVLSGAAERSGVTSFQKLGVPVSDVVNAVAQDYAEATV